MPIEQFTDYDVDPTILPKGLSEKEKNSEEEHVKNVIDFTNDWLEKNETPTTSPVIKDENETPTINNNINSSEITDEELEKIRIKNIAEATDDWLKKNK